ncbi:cyclase family protein [Methylobacterium persicinum]|uniref:Cyclase n=1 Tax=Methylobacterium persicinum TaxID=374426 RepID=A0ABU0HKG4_9HYPH|nr:cyclase family protein [Methylobacterium persicinum]MDQ0442803.1 hypothetical protein [Methylobacterium persicinum]GJE36952.1 hypothetical protein KHHGKMAE_1007 [Methylobacterium persicinum]
MNPRWTRRPEGSTWGDFGPDDERGRLNLLTPQKVLQGVAEVREGLTFCLSMPLDRPGGNVLNSRRHPPKITPTKRANGKPVTNFLVCEEVEGASDVICDDLAVIHLQYSTQWDSLAHVGSLYDVDGSGKGPTFYNGFRGGRDIVGPSSAAEADSPSRAKRLGIERLAEAGMQGRAVMIDLRAHLGDARTSVGWETLARIMEADGVSVEAGDMVCLHTGFAERLLAMDGTPDPTLVHNLCAGLDGRDPGILDWITRSGIVALIADNYAVETYPAGPARGDCCAILPLHEHCLFKLGVNLGELWHLTPLADWLRAKGRNRFLLTAPPLRLPGAVGSPATPIATV